jgi:hypothetical protein
MTASKRNPKQEKTKPATQTIEQSVNTDIPESHFNAPMVFDEGQARTSALILNRDHMDSIDRIAVLMCSGKMSVPKHLKESKADCFAVAMQAIQWQLNPFLVAQKTFDIGGKLGYEAQLVNAVAMSCGALRTAPDFEFIGDWSKVLGKFKIVDGNNGKYPVINWVPNDEDGLGVKVTAVLRGETKPRELTLMLVQCFPRFSTQWATDPEQQITYTAVRKFIRRYAPGALLGVYTPDELQSDEFEYAPGAYIIQGAQQETTSGSSATQAQAGETTLELFPDDRFKHNLGKYQDYIDKGGDSAEILKTLRIKYTLTDDQVAVIKKLRPRKEEPKPEESQAETTDQNQNDD